MPLVQATCSERHTVIQGPIHEVEPSIPLGQAVADKAGRPSVWQISSTYPEVNTNMSEDVINAPVDG